MRGIERLRLHADLTMLARLALALVARAPRSTRVRLHEQCRIARIGTAVEVILAVVVMTLGGLLVFGFVGSVWMMWDDDRAKQKRDAGL